jgi:hypothetical protein
VTRRRAWLAGTAAVCVFALAAHARELTLDIGDLRAPGFSARGVRATLTGAKPASLTVEIVELSLAGRTWRKASLACGAFELTAASLKCTRGMVDLGGKIPVELTWQTQRRELVVESRPSANETLRLRGDFSGKAPELDVKISGADVKRLAPWLPAATPKVTGGRASGTLTARGDAITVQIDLEGLAFADATGLHAGEKIAAALHADVTRAGADWRWKAKVAWRAGAVFWQPFYVAAKGHRLEAEGTTADGATRVRNGVLELPGIGTVAFGGEWRHAKGTLAAFEASAKRIHAGALYGDVLKPLLQGTAGSDLRVEGELGFAVRGTADALTALDLDVRDVSYEDRERRFAVFGMNGRIPWRGTERTSGELTLKGAEFLKVPVGAVRVPMKLRGTRVDIDAVRVPVFDGAVLLRDFALGMTRSGWRWRFSGEIEPIPMAQLTQGLGMHVMHGSLAGHIPELRYRRGTLDMDGALALKVFDGTLAMSKLTLIDAFGRAPRFHADVDVKNLDLELLTRTFDFGTITGRVDAKVRGLELVGWQPVRFDARIESSPGRYPRKISQRAVQNISALGGAGAAAAIQRSVLRFFDQFGYDRLGLSCRLENGVCEMGGIERAPQGYVIVKGGGIPAISVIGYNRAVNWRELVERLKRVTQDNVTPIVK